MEILKGRLEKVDQDILTYKRAIRDAMDALDAAEQELDELLSEHFMPCGCFYEEPYGDQDQDGLMYMVCMCEEEEHYERGDV